MSATQPITNEYSLVQGLQRGESNAFLELYNIYHPALYQYVLRFVKSPAITEDVLQDVFLKIWEIRERIDPDLSFKAYLYRICRNSVFKLMKQMASDETLRLSVMRQFSQSVSDADLKIHWQQYEAILRASVQALPPQRQKVFLLCREQGKTYEQVAAELGISRNTVKEHMVMAMRSIRDHFLQYGNTPPGFIILLLFYSDLYK